MNGNDFMSWVLRSPFHKLLSGGMMLITVTGRKTGRKFTTPVGFYEKDDHLWVLTTRNRTWWKNLQDGAEVELFLRHNQVFAYAEPELDQRSVEVRLVEYLGYVPRAAKPLGIRIQDRTPYPEDISRVARERLFVKFKLSK
ncbi:MAG: nitroreductase/quinone reductase family protein [Anaerolineales bacterium]|nr:nitroreductase/quinone reductase family protein [Anaerolineales bacterium]